MMKKILELVFVFFATNLLITAFVVSAFAQELQDELLRNHDARIAYIQAPNTVNGSRSYGSPQVSVWFQNEGDHEESIAVYLDAVPPGGLDNPGGCQPAGRLIEKTVLVRSGQQVSFTAESDGPFSFSCTNPEAVIGLPYKLIAAVDAHADDLASCSLGSLLTLACGNALADDDNDPSDNRLSRTIRWE